MGVNSNAISCGDTPIDYLASGNETFIGFAVCSKSSHGLDELLPRSDLEQEGKLSPLSQGGRLLPSPRQPKPARLFRTHCKVSMHRQ